MYIYGVGQAPVTRGDYKVSIIKTSCRFKMSEEGRIQACIYALISRELTRRLRYLPTEQYLTRRTMAQIKILCIDKGYAEGAWVKCDMPGIVHLLTGYHKAGTRNRTG